VQEVPDLVAQHGSAIVSILAMATNPSIERTYSSTLRVLPSAAHVERWASRRCGVHSRPTAATRMQASCQQGVIGLCAC